MENASKALIIAGGILLALMILGAFVYLFTLTSSFAAEQDRVELVKQIAEFNKEYEAYQRNLLRGIDIASLSNKVQSYNRINMKKEINESIKVYITLTQRWNNFPLYQRVDITYYNFDYYRQNYSSLFYDFKIKYFKCTNIEYNQDTGKVKALYFLETDVKSLL